MAALTERRPPPLGFFPGQAAPRLYDRIVEVLRVRHYSRRTEEAYVHWIRRYIEFHRLRHPHGPGIAGPQRCPDNHDLHPCPEPRRARSPQPRGRPGSSRSLSDRLKQPITRKTALL